MICNQVCKNKKIVIVNQNIESQIIIIVKNTQNHQNFTFQKQTLKLLQKTKREELIKEMNKYNIEVNDTHKCTIRKNFKVF